MIGREAALQLFPLRDVVDFTPIRALGWEKLVNSKLYLTDHDQRHT